MTAAAPQWISVKDRLPDKRGDLLLAVDGRTVYGSFHETTLFREYVGGPMEEEPCEPTHWMALPEPPR